MTEVDIAKPQFVVVNGDTTIADILAVILNLKGYACTTAYNGEEAIAQARWLRPRFILMEVVMPYMNGIEAAIRIVQEQPGCKIVLTSGQAATADLLNKGREDGYDFAILATPVHPHELLSRLSGMGFEPALQIPPELRTSFKDTPRSLRAVGFIVSPFRKRWFGAVQLVNRFLSISRSRPKQQANSDIFEPEQQRQERFLLKADGDTRMAAVLGSYSRRWRIRENVYERIPLSARTDLRELRRTGKVILFGSSFSPGEAVEAEAAQICLLRHSAAFEAAYAVATSGRDDHVNRLVSTLRDSLLSTVGEWSFSAIAASLDTAGGRAESPPSGMVAQQPRASVLWVDDDAGGTAAICELLSLSGFPSVPNSTGPDALERMKAESFDVLVTGYNQRPMNGLEVAATAHALYPKMPIIMVSGNPPQWVPSYIFAALEKSGVWPAILHGIKSALAWSGKIPARYAELSHDSA